MDSFLSLHIVYQLDLQIQLPLYMFVNKYTH